MSTTEHGGGGAAPEGVSRTEFAELQSGVRELADAMRELREASTPKEKQEAKADVKEAKADLNSLARELGIDPKRLQSAADEARKQQRKEELRPLLIELLDEELAPEDDDDGDGDKPKPDKPEPDKPEPEPEAKPDSEPTLGHWSEKPLTELFK